MKKIDARGLDCPKPVIETKKAMDGGFSEITVVVDNETASKNLARLAQNKGYEISEEIKEDGIYIGLSLSGNAERAEAPDKSQKPGEWVLMTASDRLGEGSDELGRILARGYFYALTESEPYPDAILFINGGIRLALKDSPVLESLQVLRARGVEILVCGTCLDYFGEKENLEIGTVSNMYDIVEKMQGSQKVVRI